MEKITIGDIPAYVIGDKTDPGVIVIQVTVDFMFAQVVQIMHRSKSPVAGMVGSL